MQATSSSARSRRGRSATPPTSSTCRTAFVDAARAPTRSSSPCWAELALLAARSGIVRLDRRWSQRRHAQAAHLHAWLPLPQPDRHESTCTRAAARPSTELAGSTPRLGDPRLASRPRPRALPLLPDDAAAAPRAWSPAATGPSTATTSRRCRRASRRSGSKTGAAGPASPTTASSPGPTTRRRWEPRRPRPHARPRHERHALRPLVARCAMSRRPRVARDAHRLPRLPERPARSTSSSKRSPLPSPLHAALA